MKSKLIAATLFGLTATAVIYYPSANTVAGVTPQQPPLVNPVISNQKHKIEVVFVLDTTSSMSGLIDTAKEKIWSIANTMASAQSAPELHMGLVAFRDRGDAYVTRVTDLSQDLDSMYATLIDYRAEGGGDAPESVNQALYDAVNSVSWSQDPNSYKVIFLVGDAPGHMDYQNEIQYPEIVALAKQRGIIINAIQCGEQSDTAQQWTQIAALGGGDFFEVDQSGGAVAVTTPFDEQLATLSAALDETRLSYGDREEQAQAKEKSLATAKLHSEASVSSRARRAAFNVSAAGESNFLGEKDLVDDLGAGRIELGALAKSNLPSALQSLSQDKLEEAVKTQSLKRDQLRQEINALVTQRDNYIQNEVEATEDLDDSLDHKLYGSIKKQAASVGLRYDDALKY